MKTLDVFVHISVMQPPIWLRPLCTLMFTFISFLYGYLRFVISLPHYNQV